MQKQPNILFILIDDMGWKDLSCYGSEFYETPNVDRIAGEGLKFTDAYASCPVCSPTRASMLSGKYPARVGITNYIDWSGRMHPSRGYLIDAPYLRELPLSEKTIATSLKEGGYKTWHIGKWHLGGDGSSPLEHGFEVNHGGGHFGHPSHGYFSPWDLPALENAEEGKYLTDHLTDLAVDLIKGKGDAPFYLNMWYYSVHTPVQAKPEKIAKYEAKAKKMGLDKIEPFVEGDAFPCEHKKDKRILRRVVQSDAKYAAMIESLDENVGRLLDALEEIGELDNTLVIFTSDNGGLATAEGSPTCNAPLAEGKGWMYEGGTREPLLVRWPEVVEAGRITDKVISTPDFYPTFLEVAGLPLNPQQHVDGKSMLSLLQGDKDFDRGPVFWHYPHYGNQGGRPGSSVRDGDYKLIEFFEDGHLELYNLRDDISEVKNLVTEIPEKAAELHGCLKEWRAEIEALIPEKNPGFVPWEGLNG